MTFCVSTADLHRVDVSWSRAWEFWWKTSCDGEPTATRPLLRYRMNWWTESGRSPFATSESTGSGSAPPKRFSRVTRILQQRHITRPSYQFHSSGFWNNAADHLATCGKNRV